MVEQIANIRADAAESTARAEKAAQLVRETRQQDVNNAVKNATRRAQVVPALMLITLVLSSTGCATTSAPVPCPPVAMPAPPPISEPLPSQSYSASAQELIQAWRARLTDTPMTSAP